jgi:hypothetical protein
VEDAGEYSCEMTEEEEEDKFREFVTVAVFERQSEEEMSEEQLIWEEEGSEEIDFFGPVDVKNSKYKNSEHDKTHRVIPSVGMISSVSNQQIGLAHTYILPLVTCGLCVLL